MAFDMTGGFDQGVGDGSDLGVIAPDRSSSRPGLRFHVAYELVAGFGFYEEAKDAADHE